MEDQINRTENINMIRLQRGVKFLALNSSGDLALVKALNSWKEFYVARKRIRAGLKKLQNLAENSEKLICFRQWVSFAHRHDE